MDLEVDLHPRRNHETVGMGWMLIWMDVVRVFIYFEPPPTQQVKIYQTRAFKLQEPALPSNWK